MRPSEEDQAHRRALESRKGIEQLVEPLVLSNLPEIEKDFGFAWETKGATCVVSIGSFGVSSYVVPVRNHADAPRGNTVRRRNGRHRCVAVDNERSRRTRGNAIGTELPPLLPSVMIHHVMNGPDKLAPKKA